MNRGDAIITLQGISKRFPGVRALDHVDLTIRAGEVHALTGENGSGKSTLARIVAGMIQPDEGRTACGQHVARNGPSPRHL